MLWPHEGSSHEIPTYASRTRRYPQLTSPQRPFYISFEAMLERRFTLANQITLLRLIFVPFFVLLVLGGRYGSALTLGALAAVSDFFDGWVARTFHQQSSLGVALDPVADKILMGAGYIATSLCGILPWWLTALVLLRDIGIVAGALFVIFFAGYRPLPPTYAGKASTVAQLCAVLSAVAWKAQFPLIGPSFVEICIYAAGALTIISGIHYLACWRQRVIGHPSQVR